MVVLFAHVTPWCFPPVPHGNVAASRTSPSNSDRTQGCLLPFLKFSEWNAGIVGSYHLQAMSTREEIQRSLNHILTQSIASSKRFKASTFHINARYIFYTATDQLRRAVESLQAVSVLRVDPLTATPVRYVLTRADNVGSAAACQKRRCERDHRFSLNFGPESPSAPSTAVPHPSLTSSHFCLPSSFVSTSHNV